MNSLFEKKYFIHLLLLLVVAILLIILFQTRYTYYENQGGELIRVDRILNKIRICSIGDKANIGCEWEIVE